MRNVTLTISNPSPSIKRVISASAFRRGSHDESLGDRACRDQKIAHLASMRPAHRHLLAVRRSRIAIRADVSTTIIPADHRHRRENPGCAPRSAQALTFTAAAACTSSINARRDNLSSRRLDRHQADSGMPMPGQDDLIPSLRPSHQFGQLPLRFGDGNLHASLPIEPEAVSNNGPSNSPKQAPVAIRCHRRPPSSEAVTPSGTPRRRRPRP